MLIAFAGLPGTGKSTIARALAEALDAVWLRVDSIEEAIIDQQVLRAGVDGAGYAVAYRLAQDNLAVGRTVIGDCVNPWMLTRDAWRRVGVNAGVRVLEIEVICTDRVEHRRRVELREATVSGPRRLSWDDVIGRDYHAWTRDRLVLDTAHDDLATCLDRARQAAIRSAA